MSVNARPLRILAIGSAQSTHVASRVRCFVERGHEVYLLCEKGEGLQGVTELVPTVRAGTDAWVMSAARRLGSVAGWNMTFGSDMIGLILDFRRLVRDSRPDVVHVHFAYSLWAWMAAVVGARPLVVSVMGGDVLFDEQGSPHPHGIALTRALLAHADLITAKSSFLIGVLDSLGGYGRKAIRVVWGVDPDVFRPVDAQRLRTELGIPVDARVVLSPKILQPFYNIHVLVDAMRLVLAREPRAYLVVTEYAADERYKQILMGKIQEHQLQDRVLFAGRVDQERMPEFYSLAEVCVGIPSSDGLPQTLFEGMACGVANVVGRLGRYSEIVRDGESAIFVDLDKNAVAEGILRVLGDDELRRIVVENARGIVADQANFRTDVLRMEQAYYALCAAPQRRGSLLRRMGMLVRVVRYWLATRG